MLRERNSWKDVVFNWIMLLTVIMPLAGFAMVGATWFTFWMLGVPGMQGCHGLSSLTSGNVCYYYACNQKKTGQARKVVSPLVVGTYDYLKKLAKFSSITLDKLKILWYNVDISNRETKL